jgi:RecB family exonuclease
MAGKPTLSPTRISIYLACPVKYRWTYLDKRGRWLLRAKSYYSFGTTLHRVLERFHAGGEAGVPTASEVQGAYEESWIDAGYSSAEEMAEAFGEGRQILDRYVEEQSHLEDGVKTLCVERSLRLDLGRFWLVGRIDRLDEYPDGSLEVVDYKSGRSTVSNEEVATDLAMSIYQLLAARKYPGRSVRARILALRTGASGVASLTPDELDDLERDLDYLGRQILEEDFYERVPVPKPICAHCDFLPLCKKDPSYSDENWAE